MKKLIILLSLGFFTSHFSIGQNVGIGTASPASSAQLDVSSSTKGVLLPRLPAVQMYAVPAPAPGLVVYNISDSSYYTMRNLNWEKISYGEDNLWKRYFKYIYAPAGAYTGINYDSPHAFSIGQFAPLQTRGMIGNTLAEFGEDLQGISLVASYPGVFFNSYFNGGIKSMVAGATGNITLHQANPQWFDFCFGDVATSASQLMSNTSRMALRSDGHLFLGNGNINFSRAGFEQQGSVGTTAAIFGGDGSGISLQKNYPAIGFNHWYDGANSKSISQGYSAQLALDQNNGNFYFASWPFAAIPNATLNSASATVRLFISRFGKIGLGTSDPLTDLHIVQTADDPSAGIRLEYTDPTYGLSSWNIWAAEGQYLTGNTFYYNPLFFQSNSGGLAAIANNGAYYQLSDLKEKKNIHYLASENMLDKIQQLKPANYQMISEKEGNADQFGFISQDVEKVFPQFVMTTKENVKMLSYSSFIPVLTKGMQEQQQEIDILKRENVSLRASLHEFADKLGALQKQMQKVH